MHVRVRVRLRASTFKCATVHVQRRSMHVFLCDTLHLVRSLVRHSRLCRSAVAAVMHLRDEVDVELEETLAERHGLPVHLRPVPA